MEKTYYHGSLVADISSFYSFSHFGSKAAAMEAVFRRLKQNERGTPVVYKVTIAMPDESTIEMPDWISPRPKNLAEALASHFKEAKKAASFKTIADGITTAQAQDRSLRSELFGHISDKLLPDIKGIYYKNQIEGEQGELTLCLVCPECVTHIEIEPFNAQEVENIKAVVKDKWEYDWKYSLTKPNV